MIIARLKEQREKSKDRLMGDRLEEKTKQIIESLKRQIVEQNGPNVQHFTVHYEVVQQKSKNKRRYDRKKC